jgi:hypothetical protein
MSMDRRLSVLEQRSGLGADEEDYVLRVEYSDPDGTVVEETHNHFRPPTIPGGRWGALYRSEEYVYGKLVKVEHWDNGELTRVEEMQT